MKMQAVQVTGFGSFDKLKVTEVPVPNPRADEVLIKVYATALNNSDIWMREGAYGTDASSGGTSGWRREGIAFPRIPGQDVTGEIVETGVNVSKEYLNKKVILFPFQSLGKKGYEHMDEDIVLMGSEWDGGYAQYMVWKADLCFELPLPSFEESATIPISGLTAWHMVTRSGIKEGENVLVTGATGGVGSLAVQIASQVFGAKVTAVVRDESMREKMLEIGASDIVSYQSPSLLKDIIEVSSGNVDVALDVVGEALFSTCLTALRKGGIYTTSGAISGPVGEIDFRTVYLKHLNLFGSTLGTKEEFTDLLKAVSKKQIKPLIDSNFELSQAIDAQRYFKESKKLGKILLLPNGHIL